MDYADSVKLLAIAAVDDILEAYVPNYRNMGKACPDCRAWLVDWVHRTCAPLLAGLTKGVDMSNALNSPAGRVLCREGVLAAEASLVDAGTDSAVRPGCVLIGWVNQKVAGPAKHFKVHKNDGAMESRMVWRFDGPVPFTLDLVDLGDSLPSNFSWNYGRIGKGNITTRNCLFKALAFAGKDILPAGRRGGTHCDIALRLKMEFREQSKVQLAAGQWALSFPGCFSSEEIQLLSVHHDLAQTDHSQLVALPAVVPVPSLEPHRVVVFMVTGESLDYTLVMCAPPLLGTGVSARNLFVAADNDHMVGVDMIPNKGQFPVTSTYAELSSCFAKLSLAFVVIPSVGAELVRRLGAGSIAFLGRPEKSFFACPPLCPSCTLPIALSSVVMKNGAPFKGEQQGRGKSVRKLGGGTTVRSRGKSVRKLGGGTKVRGLGARAEEEPESPPVHIFETVPDPAVTEKVFNETDANNLRPTARSGDTSDSVPHDLSLGKMRATPAQIQQMSLAVLIARSAPKEFSAPWLAYFAAICTQATQEMGLSISETAALFQTIWTHECGQSVNVNRFSREEWDRIDGESQRQLRNLHSRGAQFGFTPPLDREETLPYHRPAEQSEEDAELARLMVYQKMIKGKAIVIIDLDQQDTRHPSFLHRQEGRPGSSPHR